MQVRSLLITDNEKSGCWTTVPQIPCGSLIGVWLYSCIYCTVNVCVCNDLAQRCADVRTPVGPGDWQWTPEHAGKRDKLGPFCGSQKTQENRERGRERGREREMEGKKTERNYREITQRGQSRTDRRTNGGERDRGRTRESNLLEIKSDRTEKKERNYRSLSPFTLSPLDRYQPSGYSITLDLIFLKTVSLSSLCLCHSIFSPLTVRIQLQASTLHYILLHWPWGPSWLVFVELCWKWLPPLLPPSDDFTWLSLCAYLIIGNAATLFLPCIHAQQHRVLQGDLQAPEQTYMCTVSTQTSNCQSSSCWRQWDDMAAVNHVSPSNQEWQAGP